MKKPNLNTIIANNLNKTAHVPNKGMSGLPNKKATVPFVSNEGYKNGLPPVGSYYRIPSDTLYNPTPYRIKATPNNGSSKWLEAYDTSNTQFPGADYVDEYPMMKKGGQKCPKGYINIDGKCIKLDSQEYIDMLDKGQVGTMEGDTFWGNKSTLQPVTIHGSKDKGTNEFYKKLAQVHSPEAYEALLELGQKYGSPYVSINDKPGFFDPEYPEGSPNASKYRPTFNPFTGNMTLGDSPGNLDDAYIAELAHRKQWLDKGPTDFQLRGIKLFPRIIKNFLDPNKKGYEEEYDIPGSIEYEAHEEIEPKLQKEYDDLYWKKMDESHYYKYPGTFSKFSNWKPTKTYKNGGWLNQYANGATQFGQYTEGGSSWMLTNPNRISTYFPRMANGGGLLSRTVTCSNCGWSWKAVDGGADPTTCHKCGGTIKMKNGGDISIPDLQEDNWLKAYGPGGQTTDGCPPNFYKNAQGKCVPEYDASAMLKKLRAPVQDNTRPLSFYDPIAIGEIKTNKENKEKAETAALLIRAGMDEKKAKQTANSKTLLKYSQKKLDEQKQKEYRTRMSQGYDPNKPIEDQYNLADINGLDQRLYRGANMLMGEDLRNPVLNVARDIMFGPGKSFVNLSNPNENYIKPGFVQGASNLVMDLFNVAPTMVGGATRSAVNLSKNAVNVSKNAIPGMVKGIVKNTKNAAKTFVDLPRAENFKEVIGRLAGIPLKKDIPRMAAQDVKALRQVQEIGRLRATNVPMAEQMRYGLENNLPEEHFQNVFGRSREKAQNLLDTGFGEQQAARSASIRESIDLTRPPGSGRPNAELNRLRERFNLYTATEEEIIDFARRSNVPEQRLLEYARLRHQRVPGGATDPSTGEYLSGSYEPLNIPRQEISLSNRGVDLDIDTTPIDHRWATRDTPDGRGVEILDIDRSQTIQDVLNDFNTSHNNYLLSPREYINDINNQTISLRRPARGRTFIPGQERPRLLLSQELKRNINDQANKFNNKLNIKLEQFLNKNIQNYPYYSGNVQQKVPGLYLSGEQNLKNVSKKVSFAPESIQSGDVFTGSMNTSHSSYLPQLKQVFKYTKGDPQFLGYKPMNDAGFLSGYGYKNIDIVKYLNSEIDEQIKRGIIPKNIQRPFLKRESVILPHYGVKQYKEGGVTSPQTCYDPITGKVIPCKPGAHKTWIFTENPAITAPEDELPRGLTRVNAIKNNEFTKEAEDLKNYLIKNQPGEDIEIYPTYKSDKNDRVTTTNRGKTLNEILRGSDAKTRLAFMAHHGSNLFGSPAGNLGKKLQATTYDNCYFGSCHSGDIAASNEFKGLSNFYFRPGYGNMYNSPDNKEGLPWFGVNPNKNSQTGEAGVNNAFFNTTYDIDTLNNLYKQVRSADDKLMDLFKKNNKSNSKIPIDDKRNPFYKDYKSLSAQLENLESKQRSAQKEFVGNPKKGREYDILNPTNGPHIGNSTQWRTLWLDDGKFDDSPRRIESAPILFDNRRISPIIREELRQTFVPRQKKGGQINWINKYK